MERQSCYFCVFIARGGDGCGGEQERTSLQAMSTQYVVGRIPQVVFDDSKVYEACQYIKQRAFAH